MEDQQIQDASSYATRLDRTLRVLQKRVREQEALLEQLRATNRPLETTPSADPNSHLLQLRALKAAYDSITPSQPWLPSPDSPLPALLAIRNTDTCIRETQESIGRIDGELKTKAQRLEKEKADLDVGKLIQESMQSRTLDLEGKIKVQTQKTSSQIAKEMIRAVKEKKTYYDTETGKLLTSFQAFIDDHLAVMLAAEQLGGPVAGQFVDVAEELLEAGFSTQGKAKKLKTKPTMDKRQKRIDQIWRVGIPEDEAEEEPWDEKSAAAADMRALIEELLNSLVAAEGKGPGTYVQLQQDSAAARFLVRAKVAQFHPNNGTKLRLFDFGGELDD